MKHSIFILLLLGFGCSLPDHFSPVAQVSSATLPSTPSSLCERLNWENDTIFKSTEPDFIYGPLLGAGGGFSQKISLKSCFLGIIVDNVADSDSMVIALFQTDSLGEWKQTYCGKMEGAMDYKTSMPDLNFDGYKDLLVDCNSGGDFGNLAVGFLFNPQNQTFQRNTSLVIENMTIDAKNKRLRSRHYTSRYLAPKKLLYGWEGDSLVLLEEAIYHADVDAIIWFKKRKENGTMQQDSISGKMEPLWIYFIEKCVWKGDF